MKILFFLKWVDVIGQTAILALFLFLLLTGAPGAPKSVLEAAGYALILTGYFLGPWQMVSCLLSILVTPHFRKAKLKHFLVAICYLLMLATVPLAINHFADPLVFVLVALAFAIPAALGIYYYVITWKWVLTKEPSGNFLRHISF